MIIKFIKQLFCRHDFINIARNKDVFENLSRCKKCGVYHVLHKGLMCEFKTISKPTGNWIYFKDFTDVWED